MHIYTHKVFPSRFSTKKNYSDPCLRLSKDLETEIVKYDCPWRVEWEVVRWQALTVFYKLIYSVWFSATCIHYTDQGKKIIQDSLAVTSWEALAHYHLQENVKSYEGYTLRKHLPLWQNVEEGTIKATDENCNPNTTCRNICVNSDKFCRSWFDLIHHWKTPNAIREKNSLAFEILILSYQYRSGHILNVWWRLGIAGVNLMWLLWQS